MGEILTNLIITEKLYDIEKGSAFKILLASINKLREENRLHIETIKKDQLNTEIFDKIKEFDYSIDDSDAFLLTCAVQHKCQFFVTTDKNLNENRVLKERLRNEFNLKIK